MLNLQMLNMPKGVKSLDDLTKGDMDAWMAEFADNAVYWNSGDSLVGKPAIDKYWRNRRANVLKLSLLRMKFG
jgi:hypothetical protein